MTTNPHYPLHSLRPGAMLSIDDGVGQSIVVFRGLLWITQDGDPRDAFVGNGETFTIDRPGRALIEAMEDTRLIVLGADAAAPIVPAAPGQLRPAA